MSSADPALLARGRSHVHTGVGATILGTLVLAVIIALAPAEEGMGIAELVGSLVPQALLAVGVLASSRVARFLTAVSGGMLLVLAILMTLADAALPDFPRHFALPIPAVFVGLLLIGAGSLLSTVTPAARAWHHAHHAARAERATRRKARSLAHWRSSDHKAHDG